MGKALTTKYRGGSYGLGFEEVVLKGLAQDGGNLASICSVRVLLNFSRTVHTSGVTNIERGRLEQA
jgi:hypothetical protein